MEVAEGQPTAFSRSTWDTSAVIFIAIGVATGFIWLVGISMVWISKRWSTREKIIATVAPFAAALLAVPLLLVSQDTARVAFMLAILSGPVVAFWLAFRMGRNDVAADQAVID